MKFHDFREICGFYPNHTSKPSIFLREYWCFCDLLISAKVMIFAKKVEISKKIIFCFFSDFYGNQQIAETPIFPKEYWWFWGVVSIESANSTEITKFHEISRNFSILRKNPGILWISAEMLKTLAARNDPQQIGPDPWKPKEFHTFWRGRFPPEM